MITCRSCKKSFTKPVRRGRPPTQCDECKGGKKAAESPVEASTPTTTAAKPEKAPSGLLKARKAPYRSGFCGITRYTDGTIKSHPQELHKKCSTQGGLCSCECHKGGTPWAA